MSDNVTCPSCHAGGCERIGPIPDSPNFAGMQLQRPMPGGFLYRCGQCQLRFRFPVPAKDELDALYAKAGDDVWSASVSERPDLRLAADIIRESAPPGSAILDIGCFDGGLLGSLGDVYDCYGIEVNDAAARIARGRGIAILGGDFGALDGLDHRFSVVTAIDVIEHVHDPLSFLESVSRVLDGHGRIVIATGNTDAWSWRLMGPRYWYCTIPEHVSFINPAWCESAAARLGMRVESIDRISHVDAGAGRRTAELMKNLLYRPLPRAVQLLRRLKGTPGGAERPPGWMSARDHMLAVFGPDQYAHAGVTAPEDYGRTAGPGAGE